MPILPVNIGEKFASRTLKKFYAKAVTPEITNTEWESIAAQGGTDRVHILSFLNDVTLRSYADATDMTVESWLGDTEDDLLLDQKFYFNIEVPDYDKFVAYVNDIDSNLLENAAAILQQKIDSFVLQSATNSVKAGHMIGSDYIRGSCYIAATGAVTGCGGLLDGSATVRGPFVADMIYRGISFDSGATWYRVSAYTSSSSITVTDWNGSTYSGGAQYDKVPQAQATVCKTSTSSNIYADIVTLRSYLVTDNIPTEGLWLTVHPQIGAIIRQCTQYIPAVTKAYENVVENGIIGYISGFKILESALVQGDATNGWYNPGGHKSFITFAHSFKESRIVKPEGRFATRYQGLNVWGAKTPVIRRKAGVALFAKV